MRAKIYLFNLILLLVVMGCDVVTTDIEDGGENPVDPQNPDYEPPAVSIISGVHHGDTLFQDNVKLKWRGNNKKCEFSFLLDDNKWSNWSKDTIRQLNYLNEGDHQLAIKARYSADDVQEEPLIIDFYVDAIQGPALWIRDKIYQATPHDTLNAEIVIEEVTETAISEISLSYDTDHIKILDCQPAVNSELLDDNDIIHLVQWDNSKGSLSAYLGVTMQNNAALVGSGAIFQITIETLHTGTALISFNEECSFRSLNDQEVNIQEKVKGIIEIE